jgi:hypothetical protein
MKTIQPIPTWVKGQSVTATIFNLRPIGGELFQSASFYYALLNDNKTLVAEGNLSLSGEDYQEWGDDDNYPYDWAASQLNLVITGDYVEEVLENTGYGMESQMDNIVVDEPITDTEVSEVVEEDLESDTE